MHVQSCCFALSSYCFFYFFVAASSQTSYYLRYVVIRQKQNFLSANWIAPADSIRNVFWLIGSSFVSGQESLVNEPGNCGEIIAVVYELTTRTQEKLFAHWAQ